MIQILGCKLFMNSQGVFSIDSNKNNIKDQRTEMSFNNTKFILYNSSKTKVQVDDEIYYKLKIHKM